MKLDQLGTDEKEELWRNQGENQGRTMDKGWKNSGTKEAKERRRKTKGNKIWISQSSGKKTRSKSNDRNTESEVKRRENKEKQGLKETK